MNNIGDIVQFGIWPQNDSFATSIDWFVIKATEHQALLLSKYILDLCTYNEEWADSKIRNWLNSDFYNIAFSEDEKGRILETALMNDTSIWFEIEYDYGRRWPASLIREISRPTRDRVFLPEARDLLTANFSNNSNAVIPSKQEYFHGEGFCKGPYCSKRNRPSLFDFRDHLPESIMISELTKYAQRKQECQTYKSMYGEWWLRDKGQVYIQKPFLDNELFSGLDHGTLLDPKNTDDVIFGVRPSIWIKG